MRLKPLAGMAAVLALGLASPALQAARYSSEPVGAVYLLGSAGVRGLANTDVNEYMNVGNFSAAAYPVYAAHLGVQLERLLALELSAEMGPVRSYTSTYTAGPFTTRQVKADWNLATYSITPGLAWAGINPWLGSAAVSFLGVRFGLAKLTGTIQDDAFNVQGRYEQEAQVFDYGVQLRTEQIIVGHISIGLEGGYDWTRFPQITNRSGSGAYANVHSPERDVTSIGHNGDTTVLDFSGWYVRAVVGLWTNAPVEVDTDMDGEGD